MESVILKTILSEEADVVKAERMFQFATLLEKSLKQNWMVDIFLI